MNHLSIVLLLVPAVAGARGRITLDRPRHVVVLQDHGSAVPAVSAQIDGVPLWFAGERGRMFNCKLPLGRSYSGLRRFADDDAEQPDMKKTRLEKQNKILNLARWAPIRHRCHAWRWNNKADALDRWSYRWCFKSEAMMWSSSPWSERHAIGWHNESRDEGHANGSVTLHFVNGTGGRSGIVRCNCGYGATNVTALEIDREQLRHTLTLSMASCCAFRWANGTRWSLLETFQWLTSPLNNRDCFLFRRDPIKMSFCPSNHTLIRSFLSNSPSSSMETFNDETSTEDLDHSAKADSREHTVEVGSGIVSVRLVPARPSVNVYASDVDADGVGSAGIIGRLDESFSTRKGIAAVSSLNDALDMNNLGRHNALEIELRAGRVCESSRLWERVFVRWICPSHWRSRSPQREEGDTALIAIEQPDKCTTIAWMSSLFLCAHDQLLPPTAEALQINCRNHDEPSNSHPAEQDSSTIVLSKEISNAQAPPTIMQDLQVFLRSSGITSPVSDRFGIKFSVGQVVHNLEDGTRGVIIAWQRPSLKPYEILEGPRYLVLIDNRHLPFVGTTLHISSKLSGRALWVGQKSLNHWRVDSSATSPVHLPNGAIGEIFERYDRVNRRYVPVDSLHHFFPEDSEIHVELDAVRPRRETQIQGLGDMTTSFESLKDRLNNAQLLVPSTEGSIQTKHEDVAAEPSENADKASPMETKLGQLRNKQDELQKKLAELKQLQDKFNALTQLTETLHATGAQKASPDGDSGLEHELGDAVKEADDSSPSTLAQEEELSSDSVTRLLELAGIYEDSGIGEELRSALKDIGVDTETMNGGSTIGEELQHVLNGAGIDVVDDSQNLHLGFDKSAEEQEDTSVFRDVEIQ